MGGAAKAVGSVVNPKNIKRGITAGMTGGLSEFARGRDAFGGVSNPLGLRSALMGNPDAADLSGGPGGQDPATMLSQTGGAPLLANIAMGVDPEEALAGYFGKNKNDGSWKEFLGTLNQKDLDSVNSVHGQLNTIQQNRDLRQKAVDNVIKDFPNIAKNSAQARAQAGGDFDEVTKGYMQQALEGVGAKFGANGGLSSGAANEAYAKTGAEMGMQKLGYMGDREQVSYNQGLNEYNNRLGEVNALRDFQNTMLGNGVQQGFSAQQANLQRQFQGQSMANDQANQRYLADQQSKNALFGAVGAIGGSLIGAPMLGASLFGGLAPQVKSPYGGGGYNKGPGMDTSQYSPRGY